VPDLGRIPCQDSLFVARYRAICIGPALHVMMLFDLEADPSRFTRAHTRAGMGSVRHGTGGCGTRLVGVRRRGDEAEGQQHARDERSSCSGHKSSFQAAVMCLQVQRCMASAR
jgi:hypothetical protein